MRINRPVICSYVDRMCWRPADHLNAREPGQRGRCSPLVRRAYGLPRPHGASALLTASERMGDGRRHRVRRSSVRDLSARQRGIRIDFEGDGD